MLPSSIIIIIIIIIMQRNSKLLSVLTSTQLLLLCSIIYVLIWLLSIFIYCTLFYWLLFIIFLFLSYIHFNSSLLSRSFIFLRLIFCCTAHWYCFYNNLLRYRRNKFIYLIKIFNCRVEFCHWKCVVTQFILVHLLSAYLRKEDAKWESTRLVFSSMMKVK